MPPTKKGQDYSVTWSGPSRAGNNLIDPFQAESDGIGIVDEAQGLLREAVILLSKAKDGIPGSGGGKPRTPVNEYLAQTTKAHQILSKACRMLQAEGQAMVKTADERDRYRDILLSQQQKKLLASGTNIQAAFSTLLEIQANIKQIVTVTVSEWIEDTLSVLESHGHALPHLVAQIFIQCNEVIEHRHNEHLLFFLGGVKVDSQACGLDQETSDFMLQHMRRHYLTLFPLEGDDLQAACENIFNRLGAWLSEQTATWSESTAKEKMLENPGLHKVIKEYLFILVNTTLQHPPVEFAKDCGADEGFDLRLHEESIDGDALRAGEKCVVVFPALLAETEGTQGPKLLTKTFVLPAGSNSP